MTTNIEKRGGLLGVEKRAEADKRTLVGYAAVFNQDADIGGWWIERLDPGAFANTLGGDIRALVDHDTGRIIGRSKSGTLRLSTDERGLKVEIDVPNTSDGNDLWELVDRGDVSGMSFGFRVLRQEWDERGETDIRIIKEVELIEVSAVAFPAYDGTEIGKRSHDEWRSALDAERKEKPVETITPDPAAAPVSRAALTKARLKMGIDLKTRSTR